MPSKRSQYIDEDFSDQVAKAVPEQIEAAAKGKLDEAVDALFLLEKQARRAGDMQSCCKLARTIVKICVDCQSWKQLNDCLVLLSKRRGQGKTVIQEAVQEAMSYLDQLEDMEVVLELIATLRLITEGKIFVEGERAELTKRLAAIQESRGNVEEAAKTLQEVQVETLSKMDMADKLDYILEQTRLCLDCNDFIRARILSKKINLKVINKPEHAQQKLRFHTLMVRYYSHEQEYLEIARAYQAMYNTECVQEDADRWPEVLKLLCIFTVLAPHSTEQSDLLHRTHELKNLADLTTYRQLLKSFITVELMNWNTINALRDEVAQLPAFADATVAQQLWDSLRLRVVEHNITVISKYYSRIEFSRLCGLLELPAADVEKRLSDLVSTGTVYARIDRPKGIVSFLKPQEPSDLLNDWGRNVSSLLDVVEKTCHLIQRENMVHLPAVEAARKRRA
eukprot:CAMPEP_0114636500 /NCGR_PEP_ID=MMETSP0168-20121206/17019_1 /TAXON_ID=95228 ORGANISM="Vannella sp., Strain DIVA3 517/6/12" /NCGR_SAMPLE_ID=MMETSP0168 /ASSEMBLY_ACC=CAM_ASM_000044 /LENGTH=450 /DNA_ID=CAMNT_0001848217 /DNA_START=151 /DNA_END=1499 /DNA_ORIENTATION=-